MVPTTHIPVAAVRARTHQRFLPITTFVIHSMCCISIMGDANNVAVAMSGHSTKILVVFPNAVTMGCQNTNASKHPVVSMFATGLFYLSVIFLRGL